MKLTKQNISVITDMVVTTINHKSFYKTNDHTFTDDKGKPLVIEPNPVCEWKNLQLDESTEVVIAFVILPLGNKAKVLFHYAAVTNGRDKILKVDNLNELVGAIESINVPIKVRAMRN